MGYVLKLCLGVVFLGEREVIVKCSYWELNVTIGVGREQGLVVIPEEIISS